MTVFKTFWKIISKYKGTVILYTVILVLFGIGNMASSDNNMNFTNVKPDTLIVNNDTDNKITNNLIKYIKDNSNLKEIKNDSDAINDALFYRDVNYIIYIPENYGQSILNNENPEIEIKKTGDYAASLEEMILTRYLKVQNIYNKTTDNEDELINLINNNFKSNSKIEVTSKLDTEVLGKINYYYNFASYSILAVIILIVSTVINCFNIPDIKKRTTVSSMDYKKHNNLLLRGSFIYSLIVWFIYVLLSIIILGTDLLTLRGLFYMINLFIYSFCSLSMALLISTIINNKNAVNGVVNVVALGSSFLCGAFIPVMWLPDGVLKVAHILPAYFYINSNELITKMEVINFENLKPVFINFGIILIFITFYIILNNIITRMKLKK